MKHLSILTAALFLLAAPGAFAQTEDGGNNNQNNNNSGSGSDTGTGNDTTGGTGNTTGNENTTGEQDDDPNSAANQHNCPEVAANQNFDTFPQGCRNQIDAWVNEQTGAAVSFDGDIAVGTVLPGSVEIIEVPAYRGYGYVRLNDRRVLVDRDTRTVVRVF